MNETMTGLMEGMLAEFFTPGDPVGADRLAQELLQVADVFADAARALGRVEVEWTGAAADAFEAEFQLQPAGFAAAGHAFDEAGFAMGSYAVAFDSARHLAAAGVELFQQGLNAARAAQTAAAAAGDTRDTSALVAPLFGPPPDLSGEPMGLADREAGAAKVDQARQIIADAGDRAAAALRDAMAAAPAQVTTWEHTQNFGRTLLTGQPSEEATDFAAGGLRGVLDLAEEGNPVVMAATPWINQALDDTEWRWNIGTHSGFHAGGAAIVPLLLDPEASAAREIPALFGRAIAPKGLNDSIVLFRGMTPSDANALLPETGASAKTLGARPKIYVEQGDPVGDIAVDQNGMVWPQTGGVSANQNPHKILSFRRPVSWGGTGKGLEMYTIEDGQLPVGLHFNPEQGEHGLIEPAFPMTYNEYQELLHATQTSWLWREPPK